MKRILRVSRDGDEVEVTERCPERPYVEAQVPDNAAAVDKMVVTMTSHDQGFCDDDGLMGKPGYTWFEANIETSTGRNNIPRIHVHSNMTAMPEWQMESRSFSRTDSDEPIRIFLDEIRAGDIVQIIPKARFDGWVNYVYAIELELHCTISLLPTAPIVPLTKPHYDELDRSRKCIRLLNLHPGSRTDFVVVELLSNQSLMDESIKYEALSYCWGSSPDRQTILLQGESSSKMIHVSLGLYNALLHLRHPDDVRCLWADQLCINQNDPDELANQVGIMGEIYSRAEGAVVWLGDSSSELQESVEVIKTMRTNYQAPSDEELERGTSRGHLKPTDAWRVPLNQVSRFLSLPWFWRVWVVQEAWLARTCIFHLGYKVVDWDSIRKANMWIHYGGYHMPGEKHITLPLVWSSLRLLQDQSNRSAPETPQLRLSLLTLVLQGLDLKATDPRDKLFGLLGLAEELQPNRASDNDWLIYPNYTKTVSAVFTDFTLWWIQRNKSLRILSAIHATRGRTWQSLDCTAKSNIRSHDIPPSDHPSWALWHSGKGKWGDVALGLSGLYKASGETEAIIPPTSRDDNDRGRLKVRGTRMGTINRVGPYYPQGKSKELFNTYNTLFDASGLRRLYNKDITFSFRVNEPGWDKPEVHWSMHRRFDPVKFHDQIAPLPCFDDCFFKTRSRLRGLCPAGAKVGDVVVILYGGPVPYILRPKEVAGEYAFLGECYVEGRMGRNPSLEPEAELYEGDIYEEDEDEDDEEDFYEEEEEEEEKLETREEEEFILV